MSNRLQLTIALSLVTTAAAARAEAPPKEVKDMSCLIGSWKVKGTMTMGKDRAPIAATWTCGWLPSQWGVQCDLDITGIPGVPHYLERDLMGFDPGGHKLHWYAVTNAGETHDHVGDVPTGPDARFVYTGVQDGKPIKEVIDFHVGADRKALHVKAETFVDGASAAVLEVDGRK
jgi:hypothetical protein